MVRFIDLFSLKQAIIVQRSKSPKFSGKSMMKLVQEVYFQVDVVKNEMEKKKKAIEEVAQDTVTFQQDPIEALTKMIDQVVIEKTGESMMGKIEEKLSETFGIEPEDVPTIDVNERLECIREAIAEMKIDPKTDRESLEEGMRRYQQKKIELSAEKGVPATVFDFLFDPFLKLNFIFLSSLK